MHGHDIGLCGRRLQPSNCAVRRSAKFQERACDDLGDLRSRPRVRRDLPAPEQQGERQQVTASGFGSLRRRKCCVLEKWIWQRLQREGHSAKFRAHPCLEESLQDSNRSGFGSVCLHCTCELLARESSWPCPSRRPELRLQRRHA